MLKKAIRTAQNYFPQLREAKNLAYHWARRRFRLLHDADFALISRLPVRADDLFLDVGGNRGQSILSIQAIRPDVRIVSFEPNATMFAWLTRHFASDRRVGLIPVGLGAAPSHRVLYTPAYCGFTYDGLATFSREGARKYLSPETIYGFRRHHVSVAEQVCEMRTLDSYGLKPTFIKIDVEGCEHEVLQGALRTLATHRPVLMIERYYDNPAVAPLLKWIGYVEVRLEGDGFVRGTTTSENMICMTPEMLRALSPATPAHMPYRQLRETTDPMPALGRDGAPFSRPTP